MPPHAELNQDRMDEDQSSVRQHRNATRFETYCQARGVVLCSSHLDDLRRRALYLGTCLSDWQIGHTRSTKGLRRERNAIRSFTAIWWAC